MLDQVTTIYGNNKYLTNQEVRRLSLLSKIDDFNISKYDLTEADFFDILEDLNTGSLFSDEKLIIIKEADELFKLDESFQLSLVKYLKNPNPEVYLILVFKELLNSTSTIGKAILNYTKIIEIKDMTKDMFPDYIKKMLKEKEYLIETDAVNELLVRTDYDLILVEQELEKLMMFESISKKIELDTVVKLVSRNLEENIYELTNNLVIGNQIKTIEIYYDLIARSEDPIRIINSIGNKVRQLIQTRLLLEDNLSQEQIAEKFNIKSGVAYYLIKSAKELDLKRLEDILEKLARLDFDIKTGKIDKKIGLEILILGV